LAGRLVEETFPDEDGHEVWSIEQAVEGLVSYGTEGPKLASHTAGFVLIYVQPQDALEVHRSMAETLISGWEEIERREEGYFKETNGGEEPS
jgi:hypothetical protein